MTKEAFSKNSTSFFGQMDKSFHFWGNWITMLKAWVRKIR